jgi:hypothetical protein
MVPVDYRYVPSWATTTVLYVVDLLVRNFRWWFMIWWWDRWDCDFHSTAPARSGARENGTLTRQEKQDVISSWGRVGSQSVCFDLSRFCSTSNLVWQASKTNKNVHTFLFLWGYQLLNFIKYNFFDWRMMYVPTRIRISFFPIIGILLYRPYRTNDT